MVKVAGKSSDLKRGIDHIGVGVPCAVHDGKGKILLHKRGPKARDERGRWDMNGGAIEFGETIEEAVRRELKEELCTEPIDMEFVTAYDVHRTIEGKQTHWIQIMYSVKVNPKTVKIGEPEKASEIGWFNAKDIPMPRHSQLNREIEIMKRAGILI